jgi:hypothetical protein
MTPQLTILSLGWGVQSWTLAAMSALGELPKVDYAIHADTTWEREQTYQFAEAWTPWLEEHGVRVVTVRSARAHTPVRKSTKSDGSYILVPAFSLDEAGRRGQVRRQCTGDWKIDPQNKQINAFLKERGIKKKMPDLVERWLGISQDEWHRAKHSEVPHITHRYPLLEKKITRTDCVAWLSAHDLPSPGKSACVFCPYHNRRAWQEMKRAGGSDWQRAVEYDAAIRNARNDANATRPIDLFVHVNRVPLAEAVQIPEDYGMEQRDLFGPPEDDELVTCDSGHCFL